MWLIHDQKNSVLHDRFTSVQQYFNNWQQFALYRKEHHGNRYFAGKLLTDGYSQRSLSPPCLLPAYIVIMLHLSLTGSITGMGFETRLINIDKLRRDPNNI